MAKEKANWWDDPEQAEQAGGGDEIEGWETGTLFMGTLIRMRKGDYGFLLDARDDAGVMHTFGCPSMLASHLEGVAGGSYVRIECTGEKDTGKKSPMKTFKVTVRKPVKV